MKAHPSMTLKSRLTLTMLGVFLLSLWLLSLYTTRMLRLDIEQQLGEQQSSTAAFVAAYVENELVVRIQALERIASALEPALMTRETALQRFLEQHYDPRGVFNNGMNISRFDGWVIAEVPLATGRVGQNFLDQDYINDTLDTGKFSVASPVIDRATGRTIIGIAVAIRDTRGQVIGVVSGITQLGVPGFMDRVLENRYGKSGGYLLVSPQAKMIVAASDKNRILEPLPEKGQIPLIDRFVDGYEGAGVLISPHGVEELVAAKGVPTAGWYVVTLLPAAEAFAPIREMQRHMLLATLALTFLVAILVWWVVRRQLSPLTRTTQALTAMSSAEGVLEPLTERRSDEIGQWISSFNHLIEVIRHRESALERSEANFRHFFEKNSCVMLLIDPLQGKIVGANAAAAKFYGYSPAQLIGMSTNEINGMSQEGVFDEGVRVVCGQSESFQFVHRLASGELKEVEVHLTPIESDGSVVLFSIIHDITARREVEQDLLRMVETDLLTGVANRRHFMAVAEKELARFVRYGGYLSVFMMDLDFFKQINDTHGHHAGDVVLAKVAEVFKATLREIDVIGRLGGEEFAVILPQTDNEMARVVAERLRQTVEQTEIPMERGLPLRVTLSIGVATVCDTVINIDTLLGQADRALYQAKNAGRNRIGWFESLPPSGQR